MKKFLNHIKSRVLAGLIFLVPVFAVILLLQKLWNTLNGLSEYLVKLFGLKSVLGGYTVSVATAILLVLIIYLFGWLVKFSSLNKMREWLEQSLLQYIPGYLTYKAQLQEKISPKADSRMPVWVNTDMGKRPGFLIDEHENEVVVFFPNSPDSNNGEVVMVSKQRISKLDMTATLFIKSMQKFGKDLPSVERPVSKLKLP
jgi:uncharacterized membrane protein